VRVVDCVLLLLYGLSSTFQAWTLVALFSKPRGGEIVVVGATIAVPGITSDDDMTGIEAPIGDPKCMAIEKDMEKSEELDLSNASKRKWKKLQFQRRNHM